jgi:iron complex transport system substrate-binding protein
MWSRASKRVRLDRRTVLIGGVAAAVIATAGPRPGRADVGQSIIDAARRRVTVPARIARVFAAGPPACILIYAVAPERLVGWSRALSVEEQAYLPPAFAGLPEVGRLTGRGNTANVEAVLTAKPDVIVDYGSAASTYVSLADRVQAQLQVPYLLLDGSLAEIPRTLRLVGALCAVADRGQRLAAYAEQLLADVDRRVARVPVGRRPRVYYARGASGVETARGSSISTESLERMGARNVVESGGGGGLATVALEQVIAWDPDVIVTINPGFADMVARDPTWRTLRAVRQRRVFLAPLWPFPWIDAPPSVNRLIGLKWLGSVLYPDEFRGDLRADAREFYALFYHRAPDSAQLDALLRRAVRQG